MSRMEPLNTPIWLTLCELQDLPARGARGFSVAGPGSTRVVVFQEHSKLSAYLNSCPHTGVPLDWAPNVFMDSEDKYLQCATHGALFVPETGKCVAGPCIGDRLRAVPVRVVYSTIQVDLGGTAAAGV